MFTLHFDGRSITSEQAFHEAVFHQTQIEFYGSNLDALDELLRWEIPFRFGPYRILWENADLGHHTWQQQFLMIVGILQETREGHPDRLTEFRMTFSRDWSEGYPDPLVERTRAVE